MYQSQDLFEYADAMRPEFPDPQARKEDPETSHDAANDAKRFSKGNRLLALNALNDHGALTDFELAHVTGLQQNSIGKRRGECCAVGFVEKREEFGEVVKRPAPSGSNAIVWAITEKGKAFLRQLKAAY